MNKTIESNNIIWIFLNSITFKMYLSIETLCRQGILFVFRRHGQKVYLAYRVSFLGKLIINVTEWKVSK